MSLKLRKDKDVLLIIAYLPHGEINPQFPLLQLQQLFVSYRLIQKNWQSIDEKKFHWKPLKQSFCLQFILLNPRGIWQAYLKIIC